MAVILGMSKGSVANVMGPLKKKIFASGTAGALASTPRKRTPSKAKVVANNRNSNGDGDGDTTPIPTSYKGAVRKRKVDVDEGGEELEQSPKKRGGKKVKKEIKQEVVDKEYGTAHGSATSQVWIWTVSAFLKNMLTFLQYYGVFGADLVTDEEYEPA